MVESAHYAILDEIQRFMLLRNQTMEREEALSSTQARFLIAGALEELVNGREPEAYVTLELGDDVLTVVIVGDVAHLVRIDAESVAVSFLGQLRGGKYKERFELVEHGIAVTVTLDHPSLPEPLEFLIEPSPPPHAHFSTSSRERRQQLGHLRAKLRAWSELPHDVS